MPRPYFQEFEERGIHCPAPLTHTHPILDSRAFQVEKSPVPSALLFR